VVYKDAAESGRSACLVLPFIFLRIIRIELKNVKMKSISLVLASLASLCYADSTFSPLRPPAIPLAVKSPYLSTYQQAGSDGGNGGYLAGQWPTFWA